MKKTFTFFVAKGLYTTPTNRLLCKVAIFVLVALFALPVMAGTIDVLDDSWIVDHHTEWGGSSYNSETKTITFGGGWSGCGWYLAEVSTSDWVSITVEFASAATHGVLKCEYTDASGGGSDETSSFSGNTSTTLNFNTSKTIKQIYLQLENSGSLTLTSAVVTTSTTTYTVLVTASNGTVSGTGDFAENEEVTLTATPNENYLFTGWSSVSGVDLTGHLNDNPLTFTMPGNDVSITANFSTCSGQTVTVNVNDEDMGSATGGGSYCAGVQVDLEAIPASGYRFVNWTVTSGSASIDNVNSASAHFTMSNPAAAVTVQANFEVDPCTNSKTIQCEDYDPEITKPSAGHSKPSNYMVQGYRINGNDEGYGTAYGDAFASFRGSGDTEIFYYLYLSAGTYTFTVRCSNGNTKKVVLYNAAGDTKLQELVLGSDWDNNKWNEYTTSSWTAASSAYYYIGLRASNDWAVFDQMTITATSNVFCPNTITMAKSGDDGAAAPTAQVNSSNVTTAFEGAVVTVTAGEPSDANHYFSGWTVSPENAVTFANPASPTTTFEMPETDVTITANYGEVVSSKFTYTTSGSGSITCDTPSNSNVNSGTAISMTAVPGDNYVFTGWTATAGTFSNAATLTTTFTMPAEAATVTATFAQVDNIICYGVESGSAGDGVGGGATISGSNIKDFDAFDGNNIVKLSYEGMSGTSAYASWDILKSNTYNSANSAGATGFGFYYKTETDADKVAMWFEPNTGGQQALQLNGTSNVWKYVYFAHSAAATWNQSQIRIYINGEQDGKSTANANGAIYLADIAATSITSKPDIDTYTYTRANASNSYGTLCLPMAGTIEGATLYSVAGKQEEGGKLYIVLEEQGTTLAAGEPYIFETDGSTLTATMSGPHRAVNADANGLVGTYQQITAPAYSEPDDLNYVLALDNSNNTVFMKVGEEVTVGAYRAYINIKNAGDYSPASAAPGRKYIRFGIEGTEEEQAVEMIYDDASLRTRKIMQNGHLYILRDGHLFTAQGTQIK